ncbi:acetylglutamate kinase [Paenibacillus sp. CAU 1782]
MYSYYPVYGCYPSYGHYAPRQDWQCLWTPSKVELNRTLRSLWEQHVFWTRLTVNSIVDKMPDAEATTARLLRNPKDFAAVLEPVYGSAAASRFEELLTEHLAIAAELVTVLRDNQTQTAEDAKKRWYENADAIAVFLASINPFWSEAEWRRMMHEHLDLLSQEVAYRLNRDYAKNVEISDEIQQQALMMADNMTNGIIRQLPGSFTS